MLGLTYKIHQNVHAKMLTITNIIYNYASTFIQKYDKRIAQKNVHCNYSECGMIDGRRRRRNNQISYLIACYKVDLLSRLKSKQKICHKY